MARTAQYRVTHGNGTELRKRLSEGDAETMRRRGLVVELIEDAASGEEQAQAAEDKQAQAAEVKPRRRGGKKQD